MQSANSDGQPAKPMNILTVDMSVVIDSLSTSPSSSSPSQSDTIPPFSRQNSQSDTLETASTSSLSTLTVKFAPLPTIGPRKRRSDQPLGMAARAQLVSKKRGRQQQQQNGELVISSSPMWSSSELEEQRKRIEIMAARHAEFQARENAQEVSRHCDEVEDRPEKADLDAGPMEDPILVIGKIVKVAGKTLWSRVSKSKSEATIGRERIRDLSPMPILIKSVPPEPVPPARTAHANAWKESTQQPESRCQDDVEKNEQSPAVEPSELAS